MSINTEYDYWNERTNYEQRVYACMCDDIAWRYGRPSVSMKPKIFRDGDMWCCLLGDNIQEGICGFGETPAKACSNFDLAFDSR